MRKRGLLATTLALVMAFGLFACVETSSSSSESGSLESSSVSTGSESSFESASGSDEVIEEIYNDILILESREGESEALADLLNARDKYNISVSSVFDDALPTSLEELRVYDQIILNNVANRDLPKDFDTLMQSYVYDFGGGLFTVGGNDESGNANAYDRADMYGSIYQEMLPVTAIDYTPPVSVALIMDTSGSMASMDDKGFTKMERMTKGALSCLDALTERDYVGVMTMDPSQLLVLPMTPRGQEALIEEAISSLETGGGAAIFNESIECAGQMLCSLKSVSKRHIVVVTDGLSSDQSEIYNETIDRLYKTYGITLSVVGIDVASDTQTHETMRCMVEFGQGEFYMASTEEEIAQAFREDLNSPVLRDYVMQSFYPVACDLFSPLLEGVTLENDQCKVELNGFYGTKVKEDAELVLIGEYDAPIYARWKYGKGSVGSFMCDLNGTWSLEFMRDNNGAQLIYNIVDSLFPTGGEDSKQL